MRDAVIVSTARTPIGKAARGAFNIPHGADMAGHAARHAVERAGISSMVPRLRVQCTSSSSMRAVPEPAKPSRSSSGTSRFSAATRWPMPSRPGWPSTTVRFTTC